MSDYSHGMGHSAIQQLEDSITEWATNWTTDDLADFWHGATEACTLRLVRLKPEIVMRWGPDGPEE